MQLFNAKTRLAQSPSQMTNQKQVSQLHHQHRLTAKEKEESEETTPTKTI
jgi:hypothetical protein